MRRRLVVLCLLASQLICALPADARRVNVAGQRFRVLERGRGTPTVVFDAGLGDTLDAWRRVWPPVAKRASVFLYDRAGLGRSDPGPAPRTSQQIVSELSFLLRTSLAEPPYVLVGHSFGGLNMRLFASQYPDLVAGMVLVDATPLEFPARERELETEIERIKMQTAIALSPKGVRLELASVETSVEQVREFHEWLPDVPVIVISSTREEESKRFRRAWIDLQEQMARAVDARRHVITAESGHYVQFDEPELVIRAIEEILDGAVPAESASSGVPSDRASDAVE